MSKGKRHRSQYAGSKTRRDQEERQQKRELQDARQGYIGETDAEIISEVEKEMEDEKTSAEKPKEHPQKWYVVDTNLILSCVDVLYDETDEDWREPLEFKPNLDHAHIIIPYTVFQELNHIKDELTVRGMIARIAFDRLCKFFPNSERNIGEIMTLDKPVLTGCDGQAISLLPLHRNFSKILPFVPEKDDNDGWIAVTALAATMIREGLPVDGTTNLKDQGTLDILERCNKRKDVILLTNDKPLLSKADLFGVRVKSYSFKKRPPFTGCRELTVPAKMFEKFFNEEGLSREDFEEFMPDELPLVANEYVIMTPEDDQYPRGYFLEKPMKQDFLNIARYHKENGMLYPLRFVKHEGKPAPNAGIAAYFDAMNDDKIQVVNVTGAAGTGKTYQAVVHAIKDLKEGKYSQAIIIPSRSAKNPLGALPGGQDQKMEPLISLVKDAIRSYLAETPEFKKKRELLRRYGDTDRESKTEEVQDDKKKKKSDRYDVRNARDARRTLGEYTGSFNDFDYGSNDVTANDFREPHSKKKDKAYYPGKSDKKQGNGEEGKMTYREMLDKQVNYLYSRYFTSIPYEEAQGHSYDDAIIILDEFQRVQIDDADTLITRPGKGSKLIICGDTNQIHDSSPEKQFKNGLVYAQMSFYDEPICANIHLTENMRSEIAYVMTKNRRKVRRRLGQI